MTKQTQKMAMIRQKRQLEFDRTNTTDKKELQDLTHKIAELREKLKRLA
jgi:hypothetical protein